MTASLSAVVSAEEIIEFVRSRPDGVTSHQLADHFRIGWRKATARLTILAAKGQIEKRLINRGIQVIWSAP